MSGVRLEFARLLGWKRWLAASGILLGVAWVLSDHLRAAAATGGFTVNQWDVVLDAFNQPLIVVFVFVPMFVGLVGDIVIEDRWTPYALLTRPRFATSGRWWAAKVVAILTASVVFFLGAVIVISIGGSIFAHAGPSLSEYGRALPGFGSTAAELKSYDPPPFASIPGLGVAVVGLYTAVAVGALTALILATAQLFPRAWVPLGIAFLLGLVFFRIRATSGLHPLVHLIWGYHAFGDRTVAVEWWMSAVYLAVEIGCAFAIGGAVLRRVDV